MYRKILSSNKATNSVVLNERTIKLHTKDHKQLITKEFERSWKEYRSKKDPDKSILKAV